ncbi:MAG: hypothetical protein FJ291_14685 [Planctomycetes bacterium]|nr:hypothetical protein [Planctomycetota bacterium]
MTLGRMARAGTPDWLTPESLPAAMDRHDIAEALVHHVEARLNYPRLDGSLRLLEAIRGLPRLHPVWALEPPASADPKAARDMVEEMRAAGVRAARLMMGVAPPLHWFWRDLCEALEAHRVPCFLDFAPTTWSPAHASTQANPSDWAIDQLRDICLAHPDLPMVLSNVQGGLGIAYPILPLMRRVANLHIDITAVMDWWRKAAAELGPQRVLFATGMPFCDPATFVSNVQYAHGIGDAAKQAICGGNLRRLLEAVR